MPGLAPFDDELLKGREGAPLTNDVLLAFPNVHGPNPNGYVITNFQFPPLVKSDSKGGDWHEIPLRQAEPLPLYKGGTPRIIDLRWTYIITNQYQGGLLWDIERIANNVKQCRAYFYNQIGSELFIRFRAYDQVGGISAQDHEWTFRADNIDINYSDTLIKDKTGRVFPLRTDLSMKLKFFVNMAKNFNGTINRENPDGGPATGNISADGLDGQRKVLYERIKPLPSNLAWF